MPAQADIPHPYRRALEERDIEAFIETLHHDVEFWTPAFERPVRGRENVLALFGKLGTVFEDPVFTDEMAGDGSHVVVFRLGVKGRPIEGCDYLELDADGRVAELTVFMRPFSALTAFNERMSERLAAAPPGAS
jgi:ketosteroid isomerase-like protein